MARYIAHITSNATPEQVLRVLTDPDEIRDWSPIPFDVEDLDGVRLAAGSQARVSGNLAGLRVGFDVRVHAAGADGLELTAEGPIGFDVRYGLAPSGDGSKVTASVALHRGGGLTGRLLGKATEALLSAGALDSAASRVARAAESAPALAPVLAA
jgi:hypothetical protein